MQFKHPEFLYALFLLLIPIFIHLFQLRRFQKIQFTNVAFLKKVTLQTRKSSQIKKWLTLLMRLLAFASLIIAFAQPFLANKTALNEEKEIVLYLDNSFSLQAKGSKGALLQQLVQDVYKNTDDNIKISWFTNDEVHKNVTGNDLKNEVLMLRHSNLQLSYSEVILKSKQLFSGDNNAHKKLILLSDFQYNSPIQEIDTENIEVSAVQVAAVNLSNISIDTAYISSKEASKLFLTVQVSKDGVTKDAVSISLYNSENLIAKSSASFENSNTELVVFELNSDETYKGRITIEDENLQFDNTLYFSINASEKIKVLSINNSDDTFIKNLYANNEFDLASFSLENVDYNRISQKDLIILNQLDEIPNSLTTILKSVHDNGGSIVIIPSNTVDIGSYNALLSKLDIGNFMAVNTQERNISKISFSHPLYNGVFDKKVQNFQYPKVNSFYKHLGAFSTVLSFDDGSPFLTENKYVYLFTAAIDTGNSNFKSSPLIVPTFYNIAKNSLPLPTLYYGIGRENVFEIPVKLSKDEILTLKNLNSESIPLQQTLANKVRITTSDIPSEAGIYGIYKQRDSLSFISYNYNRSENNFQYKNIGEIEGINVYNSVTELFDDYRSDNTIHNYWKWFVIFAILFLLIEMIILKFVK